MRLLLTLILAAQLTACATTGISVPRDAKFAPVSLAGNELDFRIVGTTVFSNDAKLVDVSEWNVDSHVEGAVAKSLNTIGFDIVKSAPESGNDLGTPSYFNFTSTYTFSGGKEGVRKAALASGADYLVVVVRAPYAFPDPFFGSNQYITGYGIYQRSAFGRKRSVNFVQLAVLVLDGKTGEVVFDRIGWLSTPRPESLWIPNVEVGPDAANLSDARQAIMPLIDGVISEALRNMKVVGEP